MPNDTNYVGLGLPDGLAKVNTDGERLAAIAGGLAECVNGPSLALMASRRKIESAATGLLVAHVDSGLGGPPSVMVREELRAEWSPPPSGDDRALAAYLLRAADHAGLDPVVAYLEGVDELAKFPAMPLLLAGTTSKLAFACGSSAAVLDQAMRDAATRCGAQIPDSTPTISARLDELLIRHAERAHTYQLGGSTGQHSAWGTSVATNQSTSRPGHRRPPGPGRPPPKF